MFKVFREKHDFSTNHIIFHFRYFEKNPEIYHDNNSFIKPHDDTQIMFFPNEI